jgi:hypothetical protein
MTRSGQRMLAAIAAAGGSATPAGLIAAHPEWFAGEPVRSATASLHLTGSYLVRLGYLRRGREMTRSRTSGEVQGGRRCYRLTSAGRAALG